MKDEDQVMEHRHGTRVRLRAAGKLLASDGTALSVLIIDGSLSGAFVQVRSALALLSRVKVRAYGASGEWMDACVVRRGGGGVAVEWLDPGSRAVCELLAMHDATSPPEFERDAMTWKMRRLSGARLEATFGDS